MLGQASQMRTDQRRTHYHRIISPCLCCLYGRLGFIEQFTCHTWFQGKCSKIVPITMNGILYHLLRFGVYTYRRKCSINRKTTVTYMPPQCSSTEFHKERCILGFSNMIGNRFHDEGQVADGNPFPQES